MTTGWGVAISVWVVIAVALVILFGMGRIRAHHHPDSAPLRKWSSHYQPGDHLPDDIIHWMQTTGHCPYCSEMLLDGPRGGIMQNLYCVGCNSAFNIAMLLPEEAKRAGVRGLPPIGQYIGTIPDDRREELGVVKFKNQVQKFLDEHPE